MTEKKFLRGLKAKPDDDALRLVYADWLEEQGDARGELLRVAVALEAAAADDPSLPDLRRRVQELRPLATAAWLAVACRFLAADDVRAAVFRGLLEGTSRYRLAFLGVRDEEGPSWYLLDRLAAEPLRPGPALRLKPESALKHPQMRVEDEELEGPDEAGDESTPLEDKETGERGYWVGIDSFKWLDEHRCKVEAGICEDAESGMFYQYSVALQDDKWALTEEGSWYHSE
jgi:uncharacterized protein (TIGR02996 family)